MRELTADEARALQRAQRRRRAADAMAARIASLQGVSQLVDDLLAALPPSASAARAALRVGLLQRQITAVRGVQALPSVQALFEQAQREALAAVDLAQPR